MAFNVNKIEVMPDGAVHVRWINTETGEFHREALTSDKMERAESIGGQVLTICQAAWAE